MSTSYAPFCKAMPIMKADEATHTVTGIVCSETVDAENEVCSYPHQVQEYRAWSDSQLAATTAAGIGENRGNIRVQHDAHRIGGKALNLRFDDSARTIVLTSQPVPDVWPLIAGGFLTSYSHAGAYLRRWHAACGTDIPRGNDCAMCGLHDVPVHYFARLAEVSYCDRGSNPDATFQFVRTSGAIEMRKARASRLSNAALGSWHQDAWTDEWFYVPPLIEPDDTTGLENLALSGLLQPYVLPAHAMGNVNTPMFDPNDDSTGLE